MGTLHEDQHAYLHVGVTRWGNPKPGNLQPTAQFRGRISHDDVITQPHRLQTPRPRNCHWLKTTLTSLAPLAKINVKFWWSCQNCYALHTFPNVLFVAVLPKYLNSGAVSDDLLTTLILWFCISFWWRDMNICIVVAAFIYRLTSLLTSNRDSDYWSVPWNTCRLCVTIHFRRLCLTTSHQFLFLCSAMT
jgi:hypothetical protein